MANGDRVGGTQSQVLSRSRQGNGGVEACPALEIRNGRIATEGKLCLSAITPLTNSHHLYSVRDVLCKQRLVAWKQIDSTAPTPAKDLAFG
jgi:hypothetical protein